MFHGDPELPNPEQLVLIAASSCQLLEFLAVAARARIDVISYTDEAEAVMQHDAEPMRITRITNSISSEIVLEPRIEFR